ncbi:MAG TPA: hypothetical protein VKM93_07755 [Terriglobia bacterium]|nr:hypothetical protein [Terriglobia bacterium]
MRIFAVYPLSFTLHPLPLFTLQVPQQSLEGFLERIVILPVAKVADMPRAAQANG